MQDEALSTRVKPELPSAEAFAAETQNLRRCMRDLAGLSALSAVWVGYDAPRLAESFADVLGTTLDLQLAFVRLHSSASGAVHEAARTQARGKEPPERVEELARALAPLLETESATTSAVMPHPLGNGTLQITVTRIGYGGHGVVLAGSGRADFPTECERLLLNVAANQAVVVLQQREGEAERGQVLVREQRRAEQLQRLAQASLAINSALALPDLLQEITDRAREIIGADQGVTSVVIEEDWERAFHAFSPAGEHASRDGEQRRAHAPGARSAGRDPNLPARETRAELRARYAEHGSARDAAVPGSNRDWLAVPLTTRRGENLGLVQLSHKKAGQFTGEDEAILVQLAQLASVAIENTRLYERTQEAEQRLRVLVNSLNAILWEADPETFHTTFVSQRAVSLLGYPVARWLEPGFWESILHPDDREVTIARCHEATTQGRDYDVEYRVLAADGRTVWLHDIAYVLKGAAGQAVQVGGVMVDVTQWKRLEDTLAQRLDELAVASRRKDEFLAMLAHELRNPLAPIRNAAHLLRRRCEGDPVLQRTQGIIERQVTHLTRLVDDLLDVARINRGHIELRKTELDLAEIVGEAVEAVREAVDTRGHHLSVRLPPEPVWVVGDRTRLVQIIGNVLTNAAKYTPDGGRIQLTGELEGSPGARRVALRFRDNGQGIAPDVLPRIFDLFTQAERSLDRSEGGLGIGLTLVKELVEQHGGTIEARSAGLGQGSEFVVRLPVLAGAPPRRRETRTAPSFSGPGRRVLLVEDNRDAAATLEEVLEGWGHQVQCAPDGPAALQVAPGFRPEVVLLDIGLPQMDGYEVARRLRSEGRAEGAFLVALTGYAHAEHQTAAREAGFDHLLVKPVDLEQLQRLLVEVRDRPPPG